MLVIVKGSNVMILAMEEIDAKSVREEDSDGVAELLSFCFLALKI